MNSKPFGAFSVKNDPKIVLPFRLSETRAHNMEREGSISACATKVRRTNIKCCLFLFSFLLFVVFLAHGLATTSSVSTTLFLDKTGHPVSPRSGSSNGACIDEVCVLGAIIAGGTLDDIKRCLALSPECVKFASVLQTKNEASKSLQASDLDSLDFTSSHKQTMLKKLTAEGGKDPLGHVQNVNFDDRDEWEKNFAIKNRKLENENENNALSSIPVIQRPAGLRENEKENGVIPSGVKVKPGTFAIVTAVGSSQRKDEWYSLEKDYSVIAPYALQNFNVYAQKHGYALFLMNANLADPMKKFYWVKLETLKYYLDLGFDWVFYTDIDFLFLNTTKKLEEIVSLAGPEKHIIASRECLPESTLDKVMSGTMLLRNSEISRGVLTAWEGLYEEYKLRLNTDQDAFERLTMRGGKYHQYVQNLAPRDFMTYHMDGCEKGPVDLLNSDRYFGIHFPGELKTKELPAYYHEWAKRLDSKDKHPQHLVYDFTPLER